MRRSVTVGGARARWRWQASLVAALVVCSTATAMAVSGTGTALAQGGICTSSSVSSAQSNFNGTAIGAGHVIWFNAVFNPQGLPQSGGTIDFVNQTITGVPGLGTINVPNSYITFSPSASMATTSFNTTENAWITTLPTSHLSGNQFLAAIPVVVPSGLPGGGVSPTWSGTFESTISGLTLQWQWAAATYYPGFPTLPSGYNAIGVKPTDDNKASQYQNSDHAGTPENETGLKDGGGATGGGGSNYTGSYSGTAHFTPCTPQSPTFAVGYADTYGQRLPTSVPSPWQGGVSVPNPSLPVEFIGATAAGASGVGNYWDGSAIRIDNPVLGQPITFTGTGSNVVIGICTYRPWGGSSMTVLPGQSLILTQTGGPDPCGPQTLAAFPALGAGFTLMADADVHNLDTSESNFQSLAAEVIAGTQPSGCPPADTLVPQVSLVLNGSTTTFADPAQILNTGGVDIGNKECLTNEFHQWAAP